MCGIVGCIGFKASRKYVIEGLKILDYRGYDSAGIAFLEEKGISVFKDAGSVSHLDGLIPKNMVGGPAIGHTRWATHGKPNKVNSHPHLSYRGEFCLVHNGVIENFAEIRDDLLKKGIAFASETDSEVIVNLIESYVHQGCEVLEALALTKARLKGSYAVALLHKGEQRLYLLKNASPLLVGLGEGFNLVASDASPMIAYTERFLELEDGEYGYIDAKGYVLFDEKGRVGEKEAVTKTAEAVAHDLKGYDHFMLKEIEEIGGVVSSLSSCYEDVEALYPEMIAKMRESDHIIFLGCGTSYHASLVGGRYFEEIGIPTASYIASEWAFHPMFPGKKPFIILISQSGETADLIHCLKIIKERGFETLIITNTKGSTLERGCTYSFLLHAGVEVSVASTKAYVAQVVALLLLVCAVTRESTIIGDLKVASAMVYRLQKTQKENIRNIAKAIKNERDVFYLGRGYDYYLSLEASLKLKEISYIHSEAIAGGELKHGPIALIEKGTPVVVFITDEATASSMRGNVQEVKSRGALVYVISCAALSQPGDAIVIEDFPSRLSSIISSSLAFYLAYYVSLLKGFNVDKPRNLAKSVTVE